MITLQGILMIGVLIGFLVAYSSLFYLKDGLPQNLIPGKELKRHYRSPGYTLWKWSLGLITMGWLGFYTIELRLKPDLAREMPLDLICIALGSLALLISPFLIKRQPDMNVKNNVAGEAHNHLRSRGRQLAGIGALWFGAGTVMLILTRVI